MKNEQQPLLLSASPVALPVYVAAQRPRRSLSHKALFLGLAAFATLFWITHSGMLSFITSLFNINVNSDGRCGFLGAPAYEFVPGTGRFASDVSPREVSLEMKGAASGTFSVLSDPATDVAVTTITMQVSPKSLAEQITVDHVIGEKGVYSVIINTPKTLYTRQCIHADVVLTLPVQKEPKMNLDLAARNSRFKLADMRDVAFSKVAVTSTNGRIETPGINVDGQLSFTSTNDILSVDNLVADRASLQSTNGRVEVSSAVLKGPAGLKIETTNSNVDLRTIDTTGLSAQSSNGAISLDAVSVSADAHLTTTNGRIQGDIEMKNGALTGRTTNGHINLVVTGKPTSVKFTTSNSPANVRIADSDFKGRFFAETSNRSGIEVTGEDLHLTGNAQDHRVKKGWKGAEDGKQEVEVVTSNGRVTLAFAA
ncbi:hypothetical protein HKX48_009388 [Thoreauomyces humboldtii]|nr:hypothetical protein HKX48_009388 [Thoreauomyces humboldtii]